jgi:hypothetical protein
MGYRVTLALLKRYPKITFRCGHFFCFQCKFLTPQRSPHHCAVSSDGTLLHSPLQLKRSPIEHLPPSPTESIQQIFHDIIFQSTPRAPLKKRMIFPFTCCLCLEECGPQQLFEGCSRSQCHASEQSHDTQRDRDVCKGCMLAYTKNRIESSPFSLPQIKCLNCSHRIPTAHWKSALVYENKNQQGCQHNETLQAVINKCKNHHHPNLPPSLFPSPSPSHCCWWSALFVDNTNYAQMRRSRCGSCHATYTPFAALAPPDETNPPTPMTPDSLLQSFCAFMTCSPSDVDVTTQLNPAIPVAQREVKKRSSTSTTLSGSRSQGHGNAVHTATRRHSSAASPTNTTSRSTRTRIKILSPGADEKVEEPPSSTEASTTTVSLSTKNIFHFAQTIRSFLYDEVRLNYFPPSPFSSQPPPLPCSHRPPLMTSSNLSIFIFSNLKRKKKIFKK